MPFDITLPSEAISRPPPSYWDEDELFLRSTGGSVTLLYATFSNCKTTFAACRAIAIAKAHDAKVLYIVAEGAGGFGALTLNAAIKDWNTTHPHDQITMEWLDDHMHLIEEAPKLLSGHELRRLKREQVEWSPNLIFLDTLGASAAGSDLSSLEVGTAIGQELRWACQGHEGSPYCCDIVVVHHCGKDEDKGPTGSQYYMNDTDQALELHYTAHDGLLQVKVTKARWGEKRTLNLGVRTVALGSGRTSVAVFPLPKDDPRRQAAPQQTKREREAEQVYQVLQRFGPPGAVVSQSDLLDSLVKREPGEGEEQFRDRREDWRKNRLPRLVWQRTRSGPGKPGPIFGLVHGVAREQPAKPRQPYTFEVPREVADV